MMKRDWSEARAKVDAEEGGRCRYCRVAGPLEAAHVISRSVKGHQNQGANNVIGLCGACHRQSHHDRASMKLLAYLTTEEQAAAVLAAGSIYRAVELIDGRGSSKSLDEGEK